MKKILFFIAAMLMMPMVHAAPEFREGVNYDVIKQTGSAQPEVLEFFSYYCPHCYKFEPIAEELKKSLPEGVAFKKNPVGFLGREMGPETQRAYAVSSLLEVEGKVTPAIFDKIHNQKQYPQSRGDLKQIFVDNGVKGEEFDGAVDSFAVSGMVSQFDRNTEEYQIRGVPAFVVNGKYLVKIESITSQDQFNRLVSYLVGLKG
ncbi:thiol:disulfide interchange protein DsbA/DsbL [Aeromonas schubertii]|uniref:Thiol:disulfide interchange protein n=1 Tax=Aeromonas schubertii TaxID=652 RepID=A0A0S2SK92_9GAMM|nr:thiol:disulfide interchange protein DsbA/DsbL [Aeromonas schubertii]ALP42123.1 thiol: disulfide interchange protein DsbA [Aeromonas schubertii]MBZ6064842.1 thiol:disulfide interchange protein DsbA/DsbL [Aeromonas schubertii]MBZ6074501.1 thiol:disulfide interchange protein DsbA/DsbL [Aeromonas schubertii]QCG46664.1 thiol:disulfide interchange protein DsbA/DsbL [Aeromonas schubertii]